ncbi:MAG: DUF3617 family protein [Myxococcota bacterium]
MRLALSGFAMLLLLVLFLPASMAAEGLKIRPGKWVTESTMTNSMMPQPRVTTRTECVTEDEWNAEDLMDSVEGCTWKDVVATATTLDWKVECTNPGGRMQGDASYRSEGDRGSGQMNMAMQVNGMNMTMKVVWKGERVGDCD